MNNLEEFYATRKAMAKFFSEEELKQKEAELIQNEMASGIKEAMEEFLKGVKSPLSIHINYDPENGVSVDIAKIDAIAVETEVASSDAAGSAAVSSADNQETPITRSPSIGFSVAFPSGTYVKRKNAKETFIAALKVIGLARASSFRGRTFMGFPLISRTHRKGPDWKCQEFVDGWYVYVNMSNETKMDVLRQISDELRLGLVIRDDTGKIYTRGGKSDGVRQGGKRAMFCLNGAGPYNKRNFVYAAVKLYLQRYPNVTYEELEKAFPKEIQGSYGVIARMSVLRKKQFEGHDHMTRYFTDDKHLLQTKDGAIFAVCTQWGDQFGNFVNHIRRFGWTVSEEQ